MKSDGYVPRLIDKHIDTAMAAVPVVVLTGPRGVGKTATMLRRARRSLFLAHGDDAAAVMADPAGVIADAPRPVLIDEWHNIPEVCDVIKREVMGGAPPGSFLLTSFVDGDIGQGRWASSKLAAHIEAFPMTQRELQGRLDTPSGVERLLAIPHALPPVSEADGTDYVGMIARGGLPAAALERSDRARASWAQFYLNRLIDRDIPSFGRRPDPYLMQGYLHLLGLYTGSIPADKVMYEAIKVSRDTQIGYEMLLQQMSLSRPTSALINSRIYGATVRQRVYLTDSALAMAAAQVTPGHLRGSAKDTRRMLETLVAMQLRAEGACHPEPVSFFYARDARGECEVGLVLATRSSGIVGVCVVANADDAGVAHRSLAWLRGQAGAKWRAGAVLHPGSEAQYLDPTIALLPISSLWS